MNTKILTLALIASALIPAAASAETGRETVSSTVLYRDLDLTDASGRDHLDHRLASAVRRACGANSRSLAEMADIRRCRREALADATNGRQLALANSTRRAGLALATTTAPKPGK